MTNSIIQMLSADGVTMVDYVVTDNGDGSFTSMTKAIYDAQIAANQTLPSELSTSTTPQAGN